MLAEVELAGVIDEVVDLHIGHASLCRCLFFVLFVDLLDSPSNIRYYIWQEVKNNWLDAGHGFW
jgi:hypothetical protein